MGKRGPQKTPTAILEHRGSWLAKTRKDEPVYKAGDISPPSWLTGEALIVWNDLLPRLKDSNVLTDIDWRLLARYCAYWVMWLKELSKQKAERCERDLERYANQCYKIERELGMTPASRTSLSVDKKDDKKDGFLRVV